MTACAQPPDESAREADALRARVAQLEREIAEHKRAFAVLQRSEQQLRFLVENAPTYILTLARDATILTINRIPEGKTPDEVIGKKVSDFMSPEAHGLLMGGLANVFDYKASVAFENRAPAPGPEGATAWYDTRLSPVLEGGEVVSAMLTGTSITPRKKAERALEESEQKYRDLVEQHSDLLLVHSQDGVIEFVNTAGLHLFGATKPTDVVGKSAFDFVHPDCRERFRKRAERGFRDLASLPVAQEVFVRLDGRPVSVEVHAVPSVSQGRVTMQVMARDVTERKRSQEALRRSEERFRAIADNLPGAVFSYDVDHDFKRTPVYVGRQFVELIGQEATDRLADGDVDAFFELIHPEDLDTMRRAGQFERSFAEPVDNEYRLRSPADGYRWIRAIAQPVRVNDATLRWHGVLLDISDRKAAEDARRRLEAQLRQAHKLQAVGQLAAGVAHDFNSVLAVVLGSAELVRNKLAGAAAGDLEGVCAELLAQITHSVERGRSLVQKLLAFGRARSWKPQPLEMNRIIEDMQSVLVSLAGRAIRLKVNPGLNLRCFRGDASQIEQVIIDLVLNARDAMPDGGELVIDTANVDLAGRPADASAGARTIPHVMIAVRDTGIGMDEESLDRAFEPFYSTKPSDKGSGLGLSIVYGIVSRGGGHIDVESEPGKGTTLRLYFPALPQTDGT